MTPRPPRSTLFPYTTLFRSAREQKVTEFIQAKHAELLTRFRSHTADYMLRAQEMERSANEPRDDGRPTGELRSEEHTSELQSHLNLVCRLLLEEKNTTVEHG